MRTSKALATIVLALLSASLITVQSSPLPQEPTDGHVSSLDKTLTFSNDWSCKPSNGHPRPLILIHGILGSVKLHMLFIASFFKTKGYCVFALDHGAYAGPAPFPFPFPFPFPVYGLDKMENSAQQLSTFTQKVMEATGAKKVDLLGYSAGTMVAEYYTKRLNGASNVENIAGIAPIHYGTTLQDITTFKKYVGAFDFEAEMLRKVCESCTQVVTNSKFINDLYAGGDALPGIQYLMVATKTDAFVTPYTNGFLRSQESNVHNQLLQDWCPNDMTGHPLLQLNRNVFNGIDAFLTSSPYTAECLDRPLMTQ